MKSSRSPLVNVAPVSTTAFGVMHEESNQNALLVLKA